MFFIGLKNVIYSEISLDPTNVDIFQMKNSSGWLDDKSKMLISSVTLI